MHLRSFRCVDHLKCVKDLHTYTGMPLNGGIRGPIMNDQLVLKGCRGVQIRVTHTRVNCLLGLMHLICF